jgi:GDP-L-fucose synthase
VTADPKDMKDVIVTGGSGFIGRALSTRLTTELGEGGKVFNLSSRDADLVDRDSTFRWFDRQHWTHDVSHIFHLAAVYKAGGWPATHPGTQFHANMAMNINLLEAWKRFFPKARLTNVVSYCMYPDHDQPHPESEMYGTEPEEYLYAYAFTKKALVIGQRAYCQEFGLSAVSAVLSTIYGPGGAFTENAHVIGALIGKFCSAVKQGRDWVEIWGDGQQEREFLYIDDAVSGILDVAHRATSPVLNLGSGTGVKISRVAEIIRAETGFKGEVRYNTNRFVGARRRVLSTELVRREINWQPSIGLEEGIRRAIASVRVTMD